MAFSAGVKLQGVDYIAPAQECVIPLKSDIAAQQGGSGEVTRHEKGSKEESVKLQLADCLACSGCVTTAETMLVQEQSLPRLYEALELAKRYRRTEEGKARSDEHRHVESPANQSAPVQQQGGDGDTAAKPRRLFAVSLSPQSIASIAALYQCNSTEAYDRITHVLKHVLRMDIVVDLLWANTLALHETSAEVLALLQQRDAAAATPAATPAAPTAGSGAAAPTELPIVTSACPGLVCHAEKRETHLVDHLSRVQSAQATFGRLLKTMMVDAWNASHAGEAPLTAGDVFHVSVQPCYDRKLEASRKEHQEAAEGDSPVVKYTDLVIATHELHEMLQDVLCFDGSPEKKQKLALPDEIKTFRDSVTAPTQPATLFGASASLDRLQEQPLATADEKAVLLEGSGGYCVAVMKDVAQHYGLGWEVTLRDFDKSYADAKLAETEGRDGILVEKKKANYDVYTLMVGGEKRFTAAIANGFHLITSLTKTRRGRKVQRYEYKNYDFVELMACGGGCSNGQGQVRAATQLDAQELNSSLLRRVNTLLHELLAAAQQCPADSADTPASTPTLTSTRVYEYMGGPALSEGARRYLHTSFNKIDDSNIPGKAPTLSSLDDW